MAAFRSLRGKLDACTEAKYHGTRNQTLIAPTRRIAKQVCLSLNCNNEIREDS